jgi:hypothetical protein
MQVFRSRPVEVQAAQFTGDNLDEVHEVACLGGGEVTRTYRDPVLIVSLPGRSPHLMHQGDWLAWSGVGLTVHSATQFGAFFEPARTLVT